LLAGSTGLRFFHTLHPLLLVVLVVVLVVVMVEVMVGSAGSCFLSLNSEWFLIGCQHHLSSSLHYRRHDEHLAAAPVVHSVADPCSESAVAVAAAAG
jgi:hypothetical protein